MVLAPTDFSRTRIVSKDTDSLRIISKNEEPGKNHSIPRGATSLLIHNFIFGTGV
jgi:hypothetical protein